MDILLTPEEKKNKLIASVLTVVISILVFLLLMYFGLKAQELLDGSDEGVEIQMGDPDAGGPDNNQSESQSFVPVKPEFIEENVQTTNQEDGVDMNETPKPTPKPTPTKPNPTTEPPQQQVESDMQRMMREARERKNSGDGDKKGTKGDPDADGKSPDGGPGGSGTKGTSLGNFEIGASFGARGIGSVPNVKSECTNAKGGKVVLDIEVRPNGQIIKAKAGARGTLVTDNCILREAEKLALQVKLGTISGAINQTGTLTIYFKN